MKQNSILDDLTYCSDPVEIKTSLTEVTWRKLYANPDRKRNEMEGRKDDPNKLPYDLIAPEFLSEVSAVLAFGAKKYEPRNWEKGMKWSRPFAALMRHMWAWWKGEDLDEETGLSHLAHAACCIMFLMAYRSRAVGDDDRPL